jgi:hypothetical protein
MKYKIHENSFSGYIQADGETAVAIIHYQGHTCNYQLQQLQLCPQTRALRQKSQYHINVTVASNKTINSFSLNILYMCAQ